MVGYKKSNLTQPITRVQLNSRWWDWTYGLNIFFLITIIIIIIIIKLRIRILWP